MRLRANDTVLVLKGRDRGKRARVQYTLPKQDKILVEGVNLVSRHTKPTGTTRQAGIIQKEMPVQSSNVMLICTHCTNPTRVSWKNLADGTKSRVCSKCKEVIE